jgi:hypothetical protein
MTELALCVRGNSLMILENDSLLSGPFLLDDGGGNKKVWNVSEVGSGLLRVSDTTGMARARKGNDAERKVRMEQESKVGRIR